MFNKIKREIIESKMRELANKVIYLENEIWRKKEDIKILTKKQEKIKKRIKGIYKYLKNIKN